MLCCAVLKVIVHPIDSTERALLFCLRNAALCLPDRLCHLLIKRLYRVLQRIRALNITFVLDHLVIYQRLMTLRQNRRQAVFRLVLVFVVNPTFC